MMTDNINISELIATRISHDLIGNIGAFANAVELLEDEDDDFLSEIKSTLKMSSDILNARLKFFRAAFGLNSRNIEQLDLVAKICADYIATLNINNPISFETSLSNTKGTKEVMLAIMMAADSIIKNGKIVVKQDDFGTYVEVSSTHNLSEAKIKAMQGLLDGTIPTENLSLYAPLFYLMEILKQNGKNISIEHGDSLLISIK